MAISMRIVDDEKPFKGFLNQINLTGEASANAEGHCKLLADVSKDSPYRMNGSASPFLIEQDCLSEIELNRLAACSITCALVMASYDELNSTYYNALSHYMHMDGDTYVWNKSYEERIIDELVTLFQHIDKPLTDTQVDIIRNCIRGSQHQYYKVFKIKKKSGGYRVIEAPCDELKAIQRTLLDHFVSRVWRSHSCAYGFTKKKSIFDAAVSAAGRPWVYSTNSKALVKVDLKDFFPSIPIAEVQKSLIGYFLKASGEKGNWCFWEDIIQESNLLNDGVMNAMSRRTYKRIVKKNIYKRGGITIAPSKAAIKSSHIRPAPVENRAKLHSKAVYRMLHLIAGTCAIAALDDRLPQGSPLSPCLSNIFMYTVDIALQRKLSYMGATYIRYADDICALTRNIDAAIKAKHCIINTITKLPGVRVNTKKVAVVKHGKPMRVVGLNINHSRPSVSRYKRKQLEAMMFNIKSGKHDMTQHTMRKIEGHRALLKMCGCWPVKYEKLYIGIKNK